MLRFPAAALFFLAAPYALAQSYGGVQGGSLERHVDVNYYAVEGTTVGDLARSLQARGPMNNGVRFYGQTDWTINAEYEWVGGDTGCRIQGLVVRVLVTITLPAWDPPPQASRELVTAWDRFVGALAAHEHNHRRLADEAAEAIRWDLATLRYADCRHADERARQRVVDIIEEYGRRNNRYDERTRHGATEGAVWPPRRRIGADVGR